MGIPSAIELAIWLNQVRIGAISITDAANAAETVTASSTLNNLTDDTPVANWRDLIALIANTENLIVGVIPAPGHTYGLPAQLLAKLDENFGACVINKNLVLGCSSASRQNWALFKMTHEFPVLDPKTVRLNMTSLIESSSETLSALHLTGNRDLVEHELNKLPMLHLPPALPIRVRNDLELAQRILLICQISAQNAQAVHSRSLDNQKFEELTKLNNAARDLMAISSFGN